MNRLPTIVVLSCGAGVIAAPAAAGGEVATPILASDGSAGDQYGNSIAISGSYAIIGASHEDELGAAAGSAYVRRRIGSTWVDDAKLLAFDGVASDEFGATVAVSDTWAAVGAPNADEQGSNAGAVYMFRREADAWVHFDKLQAPDTVAGDAFGGAVALDGTTLVVGARRDDDQGTSSGSAHVYTFDGLAWQHTQKLLAVGGGPSDFFGRAVSISGDVIAVGAYGVDGPMENTGAAYVFRREQGVWSHEQRLEANDAAWNAFLGVSVDVSGDYVIVGTPEDSTIGPSTGAAYMFHHVGTGWMQQDKLMASNAGDFDEFGLSVSVSGDVAVIGAHLHEEQYHDSGAAYVFRRIGGSWIEDTMIMPPVPFYWDEFGYAVDVSGDTVVVGAVRDDDLGNNSGAAFVVDLDGASSCPADLDGSGAIDFGDVLAVIAAWGPCQGCPEDINQDGEVSFADILVVIGAWGPC